MMPYAQSRVMQAKAAFDLVEGDDLIVFFFEHDQIVAMHHWLFHYDSERTACGKLAYIVLSLLSQLL